MMSHTRVRKAPSSDKDTRGRHCLGKVSGDCTIPKHPKRNKSNNKLPKSIRYDLENALIGLCDVWFEDIKPHLVRNNIKLHVHESGAGAEVNEGAKAGDANSDHTRLPSRASDCSHLDPGATSDHQHHVPANCAGCCSTQQAASRVLYLRPPASSYHQLSDMHKKKILNTRPNKRIKMVNKGTQTELRHQEIETSTPHETPSTEPPAMFSALGECSATTIIVHQRKIQPSIDDKPLFNEDLIKIIGQKHDKLLRVQNKRVANNELIAYIMNLMPSPKNLERNPKRIKENRPWR